MARTGRKADAEIALAEVERRFQKVNPQLRNLDRPWVDKASKAVGAR